MKRGYLTLDGGIGYTGKKRRWKGCGQGICTGQHKGACDNWGAALHKHGLSPEPTTTC